MNKICNLLVSKLLHAANRIFWPAPRAEALIMDKNHILVIKSGRKLFLPGGRLKTGETLSEAAVRETFEETGLVVVAKKELFRYRNDIGDVVFQFKAELESGQDRSQLSGSWEGEPMWIETKNLDKYDVKFEKS